MKHHYQTITQVNLPKATVVGTLSGFEKQLSRDLMHKGLDSAVISLAEIDTSNLDSSAYVFVLVDLTERVDQVLKAISALSNPNTKITVIIGNHTFTSQDLEKKHQVITAIQSVLKEKHLNIRVIHLYDLLDPNIDYDSNTPIGKVISGLPNRTISLLGDDQQFIYPLLLKDALTAVLKVVFSRTSVAKVYDVGGHPMSLLNFSYKVRSLLPSDEFSFTTSQAYRFDNYHLKQTIPATWSELNWYPEVDIGDTLSQVLERLKPPASPSQDSQPLSHLKQSVEPTVSTYQSSAIASILDYPLISKAVSPTSEVFKQISTEVTPPVSELPSTYSPSQASQTEVEPTFPTAPPTLQPPATEPPSKPAKPKKAFSLGSTSTPTQKPTESSKPKAPRRIWLNSRFTRTKEIMLVITLLFFTSVFAFVTSLASTIFFSVRLHHSVTNTDLSAAVTNLNHLHTSNRILKPQLMLLKPVAMLVLGNRKTDTYYDAYDVIDKSIATAKDHSVLLEYASQFGQTLMGNGTTNTKELLSDIQTETQSLYYDLGLINSLLKSNPDMKSISLFGIGQSIQRLDTTLVSAQDKLLAAQPIIKSSNDLMGFNGKRTYLVLLQNNAELRPTGGFIGSFALITIEKGQLLDIVVEDVYTADGQLKGYVKPPEPIERYLGEASWFLRDSNWDFHFPNTAESATWFLQKEMGIDVDGVIAVNLHVVKALLEQTGPIELTDYNETITANNLFERAEYHSEINFFPGSTQKRDFLGSLTRNLEETILAGDQALWLKVSKTLVSMAEDGEVLIHLDNPEAQSGISKLKWGGEIETAECLGEAGECVNDYLAVVEANVGVNKANYFVNRKISTETSFDVNQINRIVNLALYNASTQAEWPGGVYKNYVRFYLPESAAVGEIKINDQLVPEADITVTTEHQRKVIGFLVTVDVRETVLTTVSYTLPFETESEYVLYIDKQSGTRGDPLTASFTAKSGIQLDALTALDRSLDGSLVDEAAFNQDRLYRIELVK